MYGYTACMCVIESCVYLVPAEPEEGIRSLETGVTDGCKIPQRCWEPNTDPLQEQQV